ncbi:MAG: hypothetical protein KDB53_14615 [Planctomycetes bacterium]|nr:hypothetical protein [Planctomycetota bacterium]
MDEPFAYEYSGLSQIKKLLSVRSRITSSQHAETSQRLEALEDEVMFLNLVTRVLIRALMDRGITRQDELIELFQVLDQADGSLDGGSTGDDLAQELGFESNPVDRPKEPPKAPIPRSKRDS